MDLEYQSALRFLRPIALTLGIMNTLFLIPDYFLLIMPIICPGYWSYGWPSLIILFFGWIHRVGVPLL